MSIDRSSVPSRSADTSLPAGFTDEVMRAVDRAPRPGPARAFAAAVRERSSGEARGAVSVAWRIVRLNTSMPIVVRAQALALVVLVAASMVGGGVLGAVVTYRTVGPIVQSIAAPRGDDARNLPDAAATPPPPAPSEMPAPVVPAESRAGGPDRAPNRSVTAGLSVSEDEDDDADGEEADEADETDDEEAGEVDGGGGEVDELDGGGEVDGDGGEVDEEAGEVDGDGGEVGGEVDGGE